MATLSPSLAGARRRLDYNTMMALRASMLARVDAYAPGSKQPISREDGERGKATAYVVELRLNVLTGPGKVTDRVVVRFDLGPSTDYPFTPPAVTVTSKPLPWSPHVHSSGVVCLGEMWTESKGTMLLCHLVGHVARIFNCDEPDRGPSYVGWNRDAVAYWRDVLKCRPLTSGVAYPTAPAEVTHSAPEKRPAAVGLSRISVPAKQAHSVGTGLFRVAHTLAGTGPGLRRTGAGLRAAPNAGGSK
jgi:hypothetical protein